MQMRVQNIEPHPLLKGYVGKMWVFESSGKVPDDDMKLIVPNGMLKITIPFRNGVSGKCKDWFHLAKESSITLIGITDSPAIVDIEHDAPHGNIGIEFTPIGVYRIFRFRQSDLTNKLFPLEDVLGTAARKIQEQITNTETISGKIELIQNFLIRMALHSPPDPILEYCLHSIESSKGLLTVSQLEKKTGYGSRWLNEKFTEKVGLSPKSLLSITRFKQFYSKWARNPGPRFFRGDIYDYFYDQAHFIKEFKRFTGLSPTKFAKSENEFGRVFYKG
jgi:AraC-like DNA-binding protein